MQPWNFETEPYMISFGDNAHVASGVNFVNHDITCMMFNYMDREHHYPERFGTIAIGNNVFIGANTMLLYDVKIGNNVIIGAGSVVTKNVPDNSMAADVPCRIIGQFDNYQMKMIKKPQE